MEEDMIREAEFLDCKFCGEAVEVKVVVAEPVAFGSEEKYRVDCPSCRATNYYLESELYRLARNES